VSISAVDWGLQAICWLVNSSSDDVAVGSRVNAFRQLRA